MSIEIPSFTIVTPVELKPEEFKGFDITRKDNHKIIHGMMLTPIDYTKSAYERNKQYMEDRIRDYNKFIRNVTVHPTVSWGSNTNYKFNTVSITHLCYQYTFTPNEMISIDNTLACINDLNKIMANMNLLNTHSSIYGGNIDIMSLDIPEDSFDEFDRAVDSNIKPRLMVYIDQLNAQRYEELLRLRKELCLLSIDDE